MIFTLNTITREGADHGTPWDTLMRGNDQYFSWDTRTREGDQDIPWDALMRERMIFTLDTITREGDQDTSRMLYQWRGRVIRTLPSYSISDIRAMITKLLRYCINGKGGLIRTLPKYPINDTWERSGHFPYTPSMTMKDDQDTSQMFYLWLGRVIRTHPRYCYSNDDNGGGDQNTKILS